jgi:hypothetical protein
VGVEEGTKTVAVRVGSRVEVDVLVTVGIEVGEASASGG